MKTFFSTIGYPVWTTAVLLLIPLAALLLGSLLRKILFDRLQKWSQRTTSQLDDVVISATQAPFLIVCFIFGVYLAVAISELPQELVTLIGKFLLVLGVLAGTLTLANLATRLIKICSNRLGAALATTSLTENVTRIIIFAVGVLIILNTFGISITPILATLGVGGLAVALGLQDTLANLFAGLHVTLARQIRVGDYVKLDSGQEGYVTDINWRNTEIRTLPNTIVLVPNAKLAQAVIVNYYLPDKELAVLVEVGVHYDSDLKRVEQITSEVGKEVMKEVPGGVPTFEPFIRYHTFGDFSIGFTVILRGKEFVDQYLIKHEFIKRLHERYVKEGIVIPYPIRAVNYAQEKAKVEV